MGGNALVVIFLIIVLLVLLAGCVGFVNLVQGREVTNSLRRFTYTLDRGLAKATNVCLGVVVALGMAAAVYVLGQAAKPWSQAFTMKQFGDSLPTPIQRGQGIVAPGFRIEPVYDLRPREDRLLPVTEDKPLLESPVIEKKRLEMVE